MCTVFGFTSSPVVATYCEYEAGEGRLGLERGLIGMVGNWGIASCTSTVRGRPWECWALLGSDQDPKHPPPHIKTSSICYQWPLPFFDSLHQDQNLSLPIAFGILILVVSMHFPMMLLALLGLVTLAPATPNIHNFNPSPKEPSSVGQKCPPWRVSQNINPHLIHHLHNPI